MKKKLLIALMLVFANICFAQKQTINLNGWLFDCKGEKPRFQGIITAEWKVEEYLGQRYTMIHFPNPEGENGWGDIIMAGGVWEIITDPGTYYTPKSDSKFSTLKSFIVYDPKEHHTCIEVDWEKNNETGDREVLVKLCHFVDEGNGKTGIKAHHILQIKENANTVFATTIMDLLNYAVRRGILREVIRK